MFIKRLRANPDSSELNELYESPHDHLAWGASHDIRVRATIEMGKWLGLQFPIDSIADLSTGNAAIPKGIAGEDTTLFLGDFAKGYEFTGPITQTIEKIPKVDLFVLSETIEHVEDPEFVLRKIRNKASLLLISTPIGEDLNEDGKANPEHLWGWDQEGLLSILNKSGWTEVICRIDVVFLNTYSYQVWSMR
jgi:hypothetical protein